MCVQEPPKPIIDRLNNVTAQVLKNPDVRKRLETAGFEVVADSSQESAVRRLADQGRFFARVAQANAGSRQ